MSKYYEENSQYLLDDILRGRVLSEDARRIYYNTIKNHWIPFLKKRHIRYIDEIDTPLMARFQDYCLRKDIKRQTVNHYVSYVNNIFDYLLIRGYIKINPCTALTPLRVTEEDCVTRGCYHVDELHSIFNKRWNNEMSLILNLLIYSTGMRNSEIDRIQVKDIIKIDKFRFIYIPKSKSKNGIRVVPLHDFVYGKIKHYIDKYDKKPENLLFSQENGKRIPRSYYTEANLMLGMYTRRGQGKLDIDIIKEKLEKEQITFYSGRHFWKTLMSANNQGDVEEYFMGHKVTQDVSERYNHRDKQGQERIVTQAKLVFKILDKALFT
jgi:integrase